MVYVPAALVLPKCITSYLSGLISLIIFQPISPAYEYSSVAKATYHTINNSIHLCVICKRTDHASRIHIQDTHVNYKLPSILVGHHQSQASNGKINPTSSTSVYHCQTNFGFSLSTCLASNR